MTQHSGFGLGLDLGPLVIQGGRHGKAGNGGLEKLGARMRHRSAARAAAVLGLMTLAGQPALAKDVKICLIAGKTGALEAYAKPDRERLHDGS